jgi:protein phosphatase
MLEFGRALDVGIKRRGKKNQDALKIVKRFSGRPFLIVADGMGGFRGGREASRIVIRTLCWAYIKVRRNTSFDELLTQAIRKAHRKIIKKSKTDEALAKMGSTVACVIVDAKNNKLTLANVGDTRAYLINHEKIELISYDHSEVAELKRKGVLDTMEAQNYARKNVLTMSLAATRPPDTVQPFIAEAPFPPESVVLLCSDGLWGSVPDNIIRLTALEYQPKQAAEKLVEFANASGGPDNISILIARRQGEWKNYQEKYSDELDDTAP